MSEFPFSIVLHLSIRRASKKPVHAPVELLPAGAVHCLHHDAFQMQVLVVPLALFVKAALFSVPVPLNLVPHVYRECAVYYGFVPPSIVVQVLSPKSGCW